MIIRFAGPFQDRYQKIPQSVKKKFEKQIQFLLKNLLHPSLRAKKHDEARGIWQDRVDRNYRFYFKIYKDTYWILNITKHPK